MNTVVIDKRTTERLLTDEPMSAHTSWRIGGCADVFYQPVDVKNLAEFLAQQDPDNEIHWIGLGSNLLVRDGGIRGVVICTLDLPARIEQLDERRLKAGAGVPCTILARQCMRWQLGPSAFFAGIPGTLGGALAMNAGAFGGETWDAVESVETIDRTGAVRIRDADEFRVAYRSVEREADEWFLGATLTFERETGADLSSISGLLRKRGISQPLGQRSCGSVFRNPPGGYAAELIEAAGLKGERIGDAVVSEKHANFIINTGSASAANVEDLIELVRDRVRADSGVTLTLEVRILGEKLS